MGFFVKNIACVQGSKYDVIILQDNDAKPENGVQGRAPGNFFDFWCNLGHHIIIYAWVQNTHRQQRDMGGQTMHTSQRLPANDTAS